MIATPLPSPAANAFIRSATLGLLSQTLHDLGTPIAAPPAAARNGLADSCALLERLTQPIWIYDIDAAHIVFANAAALKVWQADSLAELQTRNLGQEMSKSVEIRLRQYQQDFEKNNSRFIEQWTLYPLGQPKTLQLAFSGLTLSDGRMGMLCEALDQPHPTPQSLRTVEALLHTPVMITLYDHSGRALYRNPAAREAMPQDTSHQGHRFVRDEDYRTLMNNLHQNGVARIIALVTTQRGDRWHEVSARNCLDAVSGAQAWLVSEVDVTDLKASEDRANYLAQHDTLTGLPNRSFVLSGFRSALQNIERQGLQAALLYIDLDNFKTVNDSLGHAAGDELLVTMAERLRSVLRERDMVVRLGGDEFLVLASAHDIAEDITALAQRIVRAVSQTIPLGTTDVRVTPSIGISLYPKDSKDVDTLMRQADMAMYSAKDKGRNSFVFFTTSMHERAQIRWTLENELRSALDRNEFEVYYQPRLQVSEQKIIGAEALLRWHHPQRGLVLPSEFIHVCEDCGLIGSIGDLVLEASARQQTQWRAQGIDLQVSVNLSPRQFADAGLLSSIQQIMQKTGCRPEWLELEITESVLLGPDQNTVKTLSELGKMGFKIAIDDFGTGYSNLAFLQRYPINTLKIDRSFISGPTSSRPITELIVTMCRMLHLEMVAEGVENKSQLAWLAQQGVHEYQGYLFSPPVTAAKMEKLLLQDTRRHIIEDELHALHQ
jgi:diguanylate cyclase (GGDEF)-like protein